jgi:serine/threonine-protein kinase
MLEVGSIVGGKFRIERILGQGGMGVVAVATHLQLDQLVALKVVHDPMVGDAEVVERFMREARASARLRSEHVCRVSDVGQLDGGAPYIVMELLEGSDLQGVIASGTLPVETAVDYVLQACVAIAEAHALGIVHRDLKPANLFLTRRLDGTPLIKVLDFGIAKATSASDFKITRTSTIMGSPGYMSPEQLRSARDADNRSDIWALGVILYELVSGRLPFLGNSVTELAVKVVIDPPEPLAIDAPQFARIVYRCLEKTADDRYPTVAALAADLAPLGSEAAGRSAALVATVSRERPVVGAAPSAAPVPRVATTQHTGAPRSSETPAPRSSETPAPRSSETPTPRSQGRATTLETAASQSASAAIHPPGKRRLGLVIGGIAVAAVAAVAAVVAVRGPSPEARSAPPPAAAHPSGDAGLAAAPEPHAIVDAGSDAEVQAGLPELRAKLGKLAAAHDWSAVLELADLGSGDPAIAEVVADARQQYLAQQARAIDAQVKQGQCARARELAAAAHQVIADDATLEARARTCKPHVAPPPTPPPTIEDANRALDGGAFAKAFELADKLVKTDPGNLAAARVAALAACELKDVDQATRYAAMLHGADRTAARSLCRKRSIELDAGPGGAPVPGSAGGSGEPAGAADGDVGEAQDAARAGQWARALSLAEAVLQRTPRSLPALAVAVVSACHTRKPETARTLLKRLPQGRQRALRQRCAEQGILL